MPTAPSGVTVRAGLYLGTTSRCRGSTGTAHGAPRYTSASGFVQIKQSLGFRIEEV